VNRSPRTSRRCLLVTAITAALLPLPSLGQDTTAGGGPQDAQSPTELDAVSIKAPPTGTRVARDGYSAPTPTNVLGQEEIRAQAPADIAEFVRTLPSASGGATSSSSAGLLSTGLAGISTNALRGLGASRTLVLLDGQRSVPSSATGLVDTNTFPQSLIRQVEVVTGGASAAYGSDAVGGVVNYILDRYYTGVKGAAEYGQTEYGDANNTKFNLTGGWNFGGGDGHLLLSAERVRQDGIASLDARDWARTGFYGAQNSTAAIAAGGPQLIMGSDLGWRTTAPGGLITNGPLAGTYFSDGGAYGALNYGMPFGNGAYMQGGDTAITMDPRGNYMSNSLQADDERDSVFGRASYWVAENAELYAQASYAKYQGLSYYVRPTRTFAIRSDNAFLAPELAARLAAAGATSFNLGSQLADLPQHGSNMERETRRFVLGGDGTFQFVGKNWDWDAYYQYGVTEADERLTPTLHVARLIGAVDAVRDGAGNIVCRSTLTNPGDGCVPYNPMGIGVNSQEALDYVLGQPAREQKFEQRVAAVTLRTNELPGWAGNISLAVGAETRTEKLSGYVDPQWASGWQFGNFKPTFGEYDVSEAFVETVIPVFKGLDLNAAARFTDYELSGEVTTWKLGAVYKPIEDITLRGTVSRDIRAPNMQEWFAAGTSRQNSHNFQYAANPWGWNDAGGYPYYENSIGNKALVPEEARSYGVGMVFSPRFLPGFSASVDYYDIEIEGVMALVTVDQTYRYCLEQGVQQYCDNIAYEPGAAVPFTVTTGYQNVNYQRSRGVDVEASYSLPLGPGNLSMRLLATRYLENSTDDGTLVTETAGGTATPDWIYRFNTVYSTDNWRWFATLRGTSDPVRSTQYIQCQSDCPAPSALPNGYRTISDNTIEAKIYVDIGATRKLSVGNVQFEAFFNIGNLFDTDPTLIGGGTGPNDNTVAYVSTVGDRLGRTYRAGLRFEF
jgi:iron complex outermembrane recepter protein